MEEYIRLAEEQGDYFSMKLKDNSVIQSHLEALQFFFNYSLITDINVKIEKFK